MSVAIAMCLTLGILLWQRPTPSWRLSPPSTSRSRRGLREGWWQWARVRLARPTQAPAVQVGALVAEVAVLIRAGALPQRAWRDAAARRPEVARAMGAGTDPAVRRAFAGAHAALLLAERVGAPPGDVLDSCVASVTEAAAADSARAAALAGPRSTARLLAALPLLGLAMGVAIGADPVAVFSDGRWGSACLIAGVLLLMLGHMWVRREVGRAQAAA